MYFEELVFTYKWLKVTEFIRVSEIPTVYTCTHCLQIVAVYMNMLGFMYWCPHSLSGAQTLRLYAFRRVCVYVYGFVCPTHMSSIRNPPFVGSQSFCAVVGEICFSICRRNTYIQILFLFVSRYMVLMLFDMYVCVECSCVYVKLFIRVYIYCKLLLCPRICRVFMY